VANTARVVTLEILQNFNLISSSEQNTSFSSIRKDKVKLNIRKTGLQLGPMVDLCEYSRNL
jgi:hypothetical protein